MLNQIPEYLTLKPGRVNPYPVIESPLTDDNITALVAWVQYEMNVTPDDITCLKCVDRCTCEFAFDPMSIFGDCLATK